MKNTRKQAKEIYENAVTHGDIVDAIEKGIAADATIARLRGLLRESRSELNAHARPCAADLLKRLCVELETK